MPFVKPEAGQGKWWRQLDSLYDNLFVLQERRFWRSVYRIFVTWNNVHVALAATKDDITKDWEELKKNCEADPELVELLKQVNILHFALYFVRLVSHTSNFRNPPI